MLNKDQLESLAPDERVVDQIRVVADAVAKERHNITYPVKYQDWQVEDILIASILWNKTREVIDEL